MKRYPKGAIGRARHLRRVMTAPEQRLWEILRSLNMGFRRQVPIGRYVADFALLSSRLVIEVDSAWHDFDDAQLHDATRDAWLTKEGYRVLRFRDQQVFDDRQEVVATILATLPPRGGKGRDGGVRTVLENQIMGGAAASCAFPDTSCTHPRPYPSPLEGEGAHYSETSKAMP